MTSQSPYRATNSERPESPQEASTEEKEQNKKSMANVFDSVIETSLALNKNVSQLVVVAGSAVSGARRTFFVAMVCLVVTTAASVTTAVTLHSSRAENRELIAALAACTKKP